MYVIKGGGTRAISWWYWSYLKMEKRGRRRRKGARKKKRENRQSFVGDRRPSSDRMVRVHVVSQRLRNRRLV
jgi:hypothetical protein